VPTSFSCNNRPSVNSIFFSSLNDISEISQDHSVLDGFSHRVSHVCSFRLSLN
jgi:hypothetical protein